MGLLKVSWVYLELLSSEGIDEMHEAPDQYLMLISPWLEL